MYFTNPILTAHLHLILIWLLKRYVRFVFVWHVLIFFVVFFLFLTTFARSRFFLTLSVFIFIHPVTKRFLLPIPILSYNDTRTPDAARMQPRVAPTSNCESNLFWPMECRRAWLHSDRVRLALIQIHLHPLDLLPR